ncbi:hypothetical protein C8J57DRAFT_434998 [Mycena rebaudengoi]|nr:hypothetical protein C8J57DRAFT_434998 [Mycena rebaudengoi]
MHENLRRSSCGQLRRDGYLLSEDCHKSFRSNGNWETMVRLAVPDPESENGFREELAYAPYMDVLRHAAGPMDLVPVPVDREFCDIVYTPGNRTISDHMNVTWRLSLASISPRMFTFTESFEVVPLQRSHYTESDLSRAAKQDIAELQGGLYGHRYHEESHPRRRLVRFTLSLVTLCTLFFLNCVYWATRKSSAFISVPGTLCIAAGQLIELVPILQNFLGDKTGPDRDLMIINLVLTLVFRQLPQPWLMVRAISPVKLCRDKGMVVPRLRWVRRTHQERTSARLDARTDWRWKCGIAAGLLPAIYILDPYWRFLVTPVIPQYDAKDFPHAMSKNMLTLGDALKLGGGIMQLILNYRAKVFSGRYKISVAVSVIDAVLGYVSSMPSIVGWSEMMDGVSYAKVLWDIFLGAFCWQAWIYSSRIPEDEDEEDEQASPHLAIPPYYPNFSLMRQNILD